MIILFIILYLSNNPVSHSLVHESVYACLPFMEIICLSTSGSDDDNSVNRVLIPLPLTQKLIASAHSEAYLRSLTVRLMELTSPTVASACGTF